MCTNEINAPVEAKCAPTASINEIQAGLSASADEASWVQTSYLVAEIVMIPMSGWLSRLLSTRVLFTLSAAGFTFFSLLCAGASSLEEMILFRALQGFSGGAMIPLVSATSFHLFPGAKRTQVSILYGLGIMLAPTLGPTLGGWLTQEFSWPWLFLINLPLGILVTTNVWRYVDIDNPNLTLFRQFDGQGLILMASFLGSLQVILEEGEKHQWFEDDVFLFLGIFSVTSGVFFIFRMFLTKHPIVNLRSFANRHFTIGCVFNTVLGIGLHGAVYIVPVFLGRVRGLNSLQIGEMMFVTGLTMILGSLLARRLINIVGMRNLLCSGLALCGLSIYWLGHLTNQSDFWELLPPQALRGLAVAFILPPVTLFALGRVPPDDLKNASALYNLMRNVGGALGIALINIIVTERLAVHTLLLSERITLLTPAVEPLLTSLTSLFAFNGLPYPDAAAYREIALMVYREALTLSVNDALMFVSLIYFIFLPLILLLERSDKSEK